MEIHVLYIGVVSIWNKMSEGNQIYLERDLNKYSREIMQGYREQD